MNAQQRGILIGVGAAVVVAALVFGITAGFRHSSTSVSTTGTGSTPTTAARAVPSTAPGQPAPPVTVLPPVGAAGAFLTAPLAPTVKPVGADPGNCQHTLIDAGFEGSCEVVVSPLGRSAAVQETGPGQERLLVYSDVNNSWKLTLRWQGAYNGGGETPAELTVSDVMEDSTPKIVAILRNVPPASDSEGLVTLSAVDVAEASGRVVLHVALDHGYARQYTGGGLEAWSRNSATTPLTFHHEVLRYQGGAWRIVSSSDIPADQVPTSSTAGMYGNE